MKAQLCFFEILSSDFMRCVEFYRNAFDWKIDCFECENEKMGMIETEGVAGAISWHPSFLPSKGGSMISFEVDDINVALESVKKHGGQTVWEKCKIQAEGKGYCAIFSDSEGNQIGLYSEK